MISHFSRVFQWLQNAFGESALQLCVRLGLEDCAKLLLENGADVYACDRKGKHAIAYAQEHKFENLHRLLLNYKIIDQVKVREAQRRHSEALLGSKRGALTATWSSSRELMLCIVDLVGSVPVCAGG